MRATNLGGRGGRDRESQKVPFGKQESSDQCQPVHAKNPQHGSPDSGPVAAQPARAPIATASSAMNKPSYLKPHLRRPDQIEGNRCWSLVANPSPRRLWARQVILERSPRQSGGAWTLGPKDVVPERPAAPLNPL